MIGADTEIKKIKHRAQTDTVDNIAQSAADNKSQRNLYQLDGSFLSQLTRKAIITKATKDKTITPLSPQSLNIEKLTPVFQARTSEKKGVK